MTPLQLSEQGKIFHSQIRHLLQQLESNLAELRGGSDYAQRKIKIAAAHSLSLGLLPSIISQMPPLFTWAIEAIDVDEAVDKLREGQSDCIFSFTTKICWKRRLTTFAYLNLNCSLSAPVTNMEKHFLTSCSHTFRY